MKNSNFSRLAKLFALSLFVCALALTGCKKPTDPVDPISVIGTWTSTYGEVFTITETSLSNGGSFGDTYAGDNLTIEKINETSGYIYIKYTRAFCYEHSDSANNVYTYDEDAPDVGKWYAVLYEDLTTDSVKLSGAAGTKSSTDTLEEAKAEFTIDNGYFAYNSECVRTK